MSEVPETETVPTYLRCLMRPSKEGLRRLFQEEDRQIFKQI